LVASKEDCDAPSGRASRLRIGSGDSPANFHHGAIRDLRVWRLVRTAEEIQQNMDKRSLDPPYDLIVQLPFNRVQPAHEPIVNMGRMRCISTSKAKYTRDASHADLVRTLTGMIPPM
jgi:glutaminase